MSIVLDDLELLQGFAYGEEFSSEHTTKSKGLEYLLPISPYQLQPVPVVLA